MNCDDARVLIHARLDGQLGADEEAGIKAHLSSCADCSVYARTFSPLKQRVSALAASIDTSAASSVLDRALAAASPGRPLSRRFLPLPPAKFKFAYAAAAVVVIAAMVFVAMSATAPARSLASTVVREHDLFVDGKVPLDTRASCCEELEQWHEETVGVAVHVPEITVEGVSVEGGRLYDDADSPRFFCAAYRLGDEWVSLYVICQCPSPLTDGETYDHNGRQARIAYDGRYTVISWWQGGTGYILVTSLDPDSAKGIFASTN